MTKSETQTNQYRNEPIAIIGMSCLFPRSPGLKAFWQLLFRGKDAIGDIPETHWSTDAYYRHDPGKLDFVYCKRGGFLPAIPFDPSEFGIPPATIEATDTSQLLALIAARDALGDAGYGPAGREFDRDRTSVVLGVTGTQEMVIPLGSRLGHPVWRDAMQQEGVPAETAERIATRIADTYVPWQENSFPGLLGNVVAGRICNRLDLGGTNCVVDAACASSMSAVHLALLELATGRSDMVITGGVDTLNDIFMHMCFSKTMILSKTGDIRPFSKDADGTVLGEGLGLLVLKRLARAEQDRDRIYAVIRGMGSSSDGKSQSIYAPRVEGQAKALRMAYRNADVSPATVGLLEAHGTGTRVGDKVELNALRMVFSDCGENTAWERGRTAVGSVKSMIGHTKAAAGTAGLIKATLALKNKVLPPTLKADIPDPELKLEESPFYINTQTRPWAARAGHPRRAGVSSFGFGGSNFHLVLEEYDAVKTAPSWDGSVEIFAFSAPDKSAMVATLENLKQRLATTPPHRLSVAYLAGCARADFSTRAATRLAFVIELTADPATDLKTLAQTLDSAISFLDDPVGAPAGRIYFSENRTPGRMAFIFPGQGSQYPGMGRELCCTFPEGLEAVELADRTTGAGNLVSDTVFPPPASGPNAAKQQHDRLSRTEVAQPAIGGVSLAMLDILRRFGLEPDAVCGHSYGELSALHAAGWIDRQTFMHLSTVRGRCMAAAADKGPQGAMLAVKAPPQAVAERIRDIADVALANLNSPEQVVLSGTAEGIALAESRLKEKGYRNVRLAVSAAFHSPLIREAQQPFRQAVQKARFSSGTIPVFANTTAEPYAAAPDKARDQLGRQMLSAVLFSDTIANMHAAGIRTFVEVGPRNVLTGLVAAILDGKPFQALAVDASCGRQCGLVDLACTLASLAVSGYPVRLTAWEETSAPPPEQRMTVMLNGANYRPDKPAAKTPGSPLKGLRPPLPADGGTCTATTDRPRTQTARDPVRPSMRRSPSPLPGPVCDGNNQHDNTKGSAPAMKHLEKPKAGQEMPSPHVADALQTVTEGLKSMQALQARTAEAHQKFLDTQAAAGRTLQAMMESVQRLAEASLGIVATPFDRVAAPPHSSESVQKAVPGRDVAPGVQAPRPDTQRPASPSEAAVARPSENDPGALESAEIPAPRYSAPEPDGGPGVSEVLLAVVSELTGYPVEMLNMDMDIEADLGIDSIKRVEILSTLEERLPDLPAVEPDTMAALKTLGQIAAHMTGGDAGVWLQQNAGTPASDPAGAQPDPVGRDEEISRCLVEVVSELTGYPHEMLNLDMDIEADLGIDSIKRVEILSTLEERLPGLPEVTPDLMGSLKTLGQIAAFLGNSQPTGGQPAASPAPAAATPPPSVEFSLQGSDASVLSPVPGASFADIDRNADVSAADALDWQIVSVATTPRSETRRLHLEKDGKVYVLDDGSGLPEALADALAASAVPASLLPPGDAAALITAGKPPADASGLVVPCAGNLATEAEKDAFLLTAFQLAQVFAPVLDQGHDRRQHAGHDTLFVTITRLDGAFGFSGRALSDPVMGGLAGLAKTAALEWPGVFCRALDVDPDWQDLSAIAGAIAEEIAAPAACDPVEIGLTRDRRCTLVLENHPGGQKKSDHPQINLDNSDVVVVSGGARGVTAAAAVALARGTGAALALLGRSAPPFAEPAWLQGLDDEAGMKRAILENEFNNNGASPRDIERSFARHRANREIKSTLEKIEALGCRAVYACVDVCDRKRVAAVLEEIRKALGPVTALVHGAGIIDDRLIVDKRRRQFTSVYDTKVTGLRNLMAALNGNPLKHLVIFSSVSARAGNPGQVDYAMANEVLNKMARDIAGRHPACRTLSINWGPWDGGMVSPALKKAFERQNVGLIPLEAGARAMVAAMSGESAGAVEIVIGAALPSQRPVAGKAAAALPGEKEDQRPDRARSMTLSFKKVIDTQGYPILTSHVIGGKPVVPFALITEWFGHGALHENPGLVLHGIDDMRILKGVKLDTGRKLVRLFAGKASRKEGHYEVDLELRDGMLEGKDVIHSRGKAILLDEIPSPPSVDLSPLPAPQGYARSIREVYDDILFHGIELRGIREILSCSPRGMVARISAAPSPAQWIKEHLRSGWIADPLVLDCAFQMATVWCFEETGNVSLPSYCASYRQYCEAFPEKGVTAHLKVTDLTRNKMTGDFTLVDEDHRLVATMKGYEAVLDASLYKAFKPGR